VVGTAVRARRHPVAAAAVVASTPASVNKFDWGILAARPARLHLSRFVSYYTVSYHGASGSENAWARVLRLVSRCCSRCSRVRGCWRCTSFAPTVQLAGTDPAHGCSAGYAVLRTVRDPRRADRPPRASRKPFDSGRGAGYFLSPDRDPGPVRCCRSCDCADTGGKACPGTRAPEHVTRRETPGASTGARPFLLFLPWLSAREKPGSAVAFCRAAIRYGDAESSLPCQCWHTNKGVRSQ